MQSTGLMLFWFVVVLIMIPVSLWLLKRSGWQPKGAAPAAWPMKTLGQLPLGPGQRVVTIEVGQGASRTCLVLGVTQHSITTLHTLPASVESAAGPAFNEVLAQSRQTLSGERA
jgi:flagellar protein FliO/FliZ